MQNTTRQHDASHPSNVTHPYADILRAIADGKQIQFYSSIWSWSDVTHEVALSMIAGYCVDGEGQFRVKPETILINGIEVPKPCSSPLAPETIYYIPYLEGIESDCRWSAIRWDYTNYDLRMLKLGLVHLTREAANRHAEALLSFTQTKE